MITAIIAKGTPSTNALGSVSHACGGVSPMDLIKEFNRPCWVVDEVPHDGHGHGRADRRQEVNGPKKAFDATVNTLHQDRQGQGDDQIERQDQEGKQEGVADSHAEDARRLGVGKHRLVVAKPNEGVRPAQAQEADAGARRGVIKEPQDERPDHGQQGEKNHVCHQGRHRPDDKTVFTRAHATAGFGICFTF